MASISGRGSRGHHTYTFNLNESSYSVENNNSTMSYSFVLTDDANWFWESWGNSITYTLSANGSTVTSGSIPNHTTKTQTITSGTFTVPHNTDGTKSINYSFSVTDNAGQYYTSGNASGSGSMTLTTIPRASSITATATNIGSATTISINRASSSFTHTVTYSFGSLSGTIATKTSNTSINWTVPTTFYAQIPNSKSGTCTLTCQTYNGNTLVGTKTGTFTVTASESSSKPTASISAVDINSTTIALTGNNKKVIKGYSNVECTYSISARNSASISSRNINGTTLSNNSGTKTFNGTTTNLFKLTATDSRGYSSNVTTNDLTLINYIPLTFSGVVTRHTPTGDRLDLSFSGNYFSYNFGSVSNTLQISWKYREKGQSSWTTGGTLVQGTDYTINSSNNTYSSGSGSSQTTISLGNLFTYTKNYEIGIFYNDTLVSSSTILQGLKGIPVINWGADYFNVNGEYKVNNTSLLDLIHPVGEVYMTTNSSFNPNTSWGGSWTKLTADAYFKIVTSNAGSLGGTSSQHKIPISSMPSHIHREKGYWSVQSGAGTAQARARAEVEGDPWDTSMEATGGGQAYYPYYYGVIAWHRTA